MCTPLLQNCQFQNYFIYMCIEKTLKLRQNSPRIKNCMWALALTELMSNTGHKNCIYFIQIEKLIKAA